MIPEAVGAVSLHGMQAVPARPPCGQRRGNAAASASGVRGVGGGQAAGSSQAGPALTCWAGAQARQRAAGADLGGGRRCHREAGGLGGQCAIRRAAAAAAAAVPPARGLTHPIAVDTARLAAARRRACRHRHLRQKVSAPAAQRSYAPLRGLCWWHRALAMRRGAVEPARRAAASASAAAAAAYWTGGSLQSAKVESGLARHSAAGSSSGAGGGGSGGTAGCLPSFRTC